MFSDRVVEREVVEFVRLGCAVEGAWVSAVRRDCAERISARSCFLLSLPVVSRERGRERG